MPVRSDYLLRLIQQLARAVARVMELRGARRFDEALDILDETSRQAFGVDLRLAVALALPDLLPMLRDRHGSPARSYELLAEMLLHDGDVRSEAGEGQRAVAAWRRGMALVLAAAELPDATPDDLAQGSRLAIELRRRLGPISLGDAELERLGMLHERVGEFAAAEDVLFAWRARSPAGRDATDRLRAFYERLLALSDAALDEGGLPRDEVEDGLRALAS